MFSVPQCRTSRSHPKFIIVVSPVLLRRVIQADSIRVLE
jgi:hypothetical protein